MTTVEFLLIMSYLFLFYTILYKKIKLTTTFGIFTFFSILYSLFSVLTYNKIYPELFYETYPLMFNEELLSIQIYLIIITNIIFCLTYLFLYKSNNSTNLKIKYENNIEAGKYLFFTLYTVISIVLIYIGMKYSYTSADRDASINSLLSGLKSRLAGFYIAYLVFFGFKKTTLVMFVLYFLLMITEQSRWYFVTVLLATLVYAQTVNSLSNRKLIFFMSFFTFALLFVGLNRLEIEITDLSLFLYPLYVEGTYGTYMILQTYHALFTYSWYEPTYFSSYLIDPLLYSLPGKLYSFFEINKEEFNTYQLFVDNIQRILSDKFAPVGGFNYIAESSAALPFIGPVIVTTMYAYFSVKIDNMNNLSKKMLLFKVLYISSFSFVFIKTIFYQTINYFLTVSIAAISVYILLTIYQKIKFRKK